MVQQFFSKLIILPTELKSRELRRRATGALPGLSRLPFVNDGVRKIDADQVDSGPPSGPIGRFTSAIRRWLIDPLKKFAGFAWPIISKILPRSFGELWSTIVQVGVQLWVFDWNATDQALQDRIKQNNQNIINAAAAALGTSLGWGAVRLTSMAMGKILKNRTNQQGRDRSLDIQMPVISGRVAAALAEEGSDEMRGQLSALLMQIKNAQINNAFLATMLHARAEGWFGLEQKTKADANDSFAQRWERKIESLPQWLRQPVENLTENFVEAVMEAGYIAANELDSAWIMARSAMQNVKGPERTIILQPDKENEGTKYIVQGSQEFVIEETERIIHEEQLMAKKDVGILIGGPLEENLRKSPMVRQLKIRWNTQAKDGPPFVDSRGIPGKWSECNVPMVKEVLSWNEIKQAADEFRRGNPYEKLTAKCYYKERYVGDLVVVGTTREECTRRLKKLEKLQNRDVRREAVNFSTGRAASSDPDLGSVDAFYPADCTLTVHRTGADDADKWMRRGRIFQNKPDQRWFEDTMKIPLWPKRKPNDLTGFN